MSDLLHNPDTTYYDMAGYIPGATLTVEVNLLGPGSFVVNRTTGKETLYTDGPDAPEVIAARHHEANARGVGVLFEGPDNCRVIETLGGRNVTDLTGPQLNRSDAIIAASDYALTHGIQYVGFLQG